MSMNTYKPKDFAKMLGVTVRTLQKWDVAGKLKAFRTPTNRRFYTQEQLDVYMGNSTRVQNQKKVILYARVSTSKQQVQQPNSDGNDTVRYRIITKRGQVKCILDKGCLVETDVYGKVFYVLMIDESNW